MKNKGSVTVVIPNYNGVDFLEKCLASLAEQTYDNFTITVVDNASKDTSIEFLDENYPEVDKIVLNENTGFSCAVNKGIIDSKADYIFLLNNDTECDKVCIEHLVDAIEKDDKIFSVNSKMIQYYDKSLIDDAGDEYNAFGIAYKRGYNCSVDTNNKERKVFSCCGGASLYRKEIFEEIGYFDENFFMYLEDVDIGYRANVYGYSNYYCPKAIVYHMISGSTGNTKSEFKTMLSSRNNSYLLYKNMPVLQLIINIPLILIGVIVKSLFFCRSGYGKIFFVNSFKAIGNYNKLQRPKHSIKLLKNYLIIQIRLYINCIGMIVERIKI